MHVFFTNNLTYGQYRTERTKRMNLILSSSIPAFKLNKLSVAGFFPRYPANPVSGRIEKSLSAVQPYNFPCGRKPKHPEKTHDFRQSVDRLFSHQSVARIECRTSNPIMYPYSMHAGQGQT
jgi:hypothetical protein